MKGRNFSTILIRMVLIAMLLAFVVFAAFVGSSIYRWQRFFSARERQSAVIHQLAKFPPDNRTPTEWQEDLITVHNVWGNVLFAPDYASMETMERLQRELDQIIAKTTTDNSVESADCVLTLLLSVARDREFVLRYRRMFREGMLAREITDEEAASPTFPATIQQ